MHPNLGIYSANRNPDAAGRRTAEPDGVFDDFREAIDNTPKAAATFGLGALAMLVALKLLGFRFAIGVNVGK